MMKLSVNKNREIGQLCMVGWGDQCLSSGWTTCTKGNKQIYVEFGNEWRIWWIISYQVVNNVVSNVSVISEICDNNEWILWMVCKQSVNNVMKYWGVWFSSTYVARYGSSSGRQA